ncbi:rhamnogalacturonan acetylesterase [Undibacterium sp. FT137W]|uniref:Rhamnogalacturonan acetylesterase n=2 Tax=Undibacterium fentianense TaxID=2828728 RepID=A0A941E1V5_9BURK|nr:rhamnogalacturonan acetylesterase [Undibacterium fentianense]
MTPRYLTYNFRTIFKRNLYAILLVASNLAAAQSVTPVTHPALRVILVGDSTMATKSGYGDALCGRFNPNVDCINLARGGRSSASFRAEGLWNRVQDLLAQSSQEGMPVYILIQFGHNDQPGKPGRSTDLVSEFPVNMTRYVEEVKQAGGVPVLVTPLTRRSFRDGVLENNLKPWADAVEKIAVQTQTPLLPLNAESHAAVQAMGEAEADTLAVAPPPPKVDNSTVIDPNKLEPQGAAKSAFDRTHVGVKGAAYFATMVERLLREHVPSIRAFLKPAGESTK